MIENIKTMTCNLSHLFLVILAWENELILPYLQSIKIQLLELDSAARQFICDVNRTVKKSNRSISQYLFSFFNFTLKYFLSLSVVQIALQGQ
jgi:hypothetical protein